MEQDILSLKGGDEMAIDILMHEAQGLPEDALMEVVRFVKFIKAESANRTAKDTAAVQKKVRHAGKYRGQIKMSDDFDAPLEEFRGYM